MSFSVSIVDSQVTCNSSTSRYLVGLFHNLNSVLDSLIIRLRFARVDGVVSLMYVILCLAVVAQLISSAYFGSISK